jgi:hypothetical protein
MARAPETMAAKLGSMPSVRLRNFSVDSDEHLELLRRFAVSLLDGRSTSSHISPELARELVRRIDAGSTGWQIFTWLKAELEQKRS